MKVCFIVAMSQNRVIGKNNQLPWHLPEDLKYFKRITSGHPVIMGRKTFESMGRPLPNRTNVIITRQPDYDPIKAVAGPDIAVTKPQVAGEFSGPVSTAPKAPPPIFVVDSVEKALEKFRDRDEEVFIIGGGEIFKQSFPTVDKLYLTLIHKDFEGDIFFPSWNPAEFRLVSEDRREEPIPHSYLVYERKLE